MCGRANMPAWNFAGQFKDFFATPPYSPYTFCLTDYGDGKIPPLVLFILSCTKETRHV